MQEKYLRLVIVGSITLDCRNGQLNISELARVCDISRTTAYKYKSLLEA